jgi:hypothetical protein
LDIKDFQEIAAIVGRKAAECFMKRDDLKIKNDNGKEKRGLQGLCHHCGRKGHKKAECFKLKNRIEVEEKGAVVLMAETLDHEESVTSVEIHTSQSEMMCQEIVNDK